MDIILIIWMFWSHLIVDFILQSDWMAQNKSKNWIALTIHVFVYSFSMSILLMLVFTFSFVNFCLFFIITFVTHFITDAITSRITKMLWNKQRVHDFFVVIGMDQAIHMSTLIFTLFLLL